MEYKVWEWWNGLSEGEQEMILKAVYNMEVRELFEYLDDDDKEEHRDDLNTYYGEDVL